MGVRGGAHAGLVTEKAALDALADGLLEGKAEAAAAAEKNASPDVAAAYTLFTTKTCPNCKAAKAILDRAGIKYDVVDAEDEPELALRYGVMQVPALVVVSFGENGSGNAEKLSGVGPINGFVRSMGCEQTAN